LRNVAIGIACLTVTATINAQEAKSMFIMKDGKATNIVAVSEVDSIILRNSSIYEVGVVINGVRWATRNLGEGGNFVENPEDLGAMYQWGRKTDGHENRTSPNYPTNDYSVENGVVSGMALDANGQVKGEHAAYGKFIKQNADPRDWRSPQDGSLWNTGTEAAPLITANDPCPCGWRLPTRTEWNSLNAAGSVWGSTPAGRTFGSGENTLFLPATGTRKSNGELDFAGTYGNYWSSTPTGTSAHNLHFSNSAVQSSSFSQRALGFAVRCVEDTNTISVAIEGSTIICENDSSATLFAILDPVGANVTYQWYLNGVEIENAVASTLSIAHLEPSSTSYIFYVEITAIESGCRIISEYHAVNVMQIPVVDIVADKSEISAGETVILTANITGEPPMTYQWYANGEIIPNANDPIWYANPLITTTFTFTATQDDSGCVAHSNAVTVTVTVSVPDINNNTDVITIFPNPCNSFTTIRFYEAVPQSNIVLYNMRGQKVREIEFSGTEYVLERGELPTGGYVLQINSSKSLKYWKIIFE